MHSHVDICHHGTAMHSALTAVILVALHTYANITLGPKQQPHERAHRREALREGGLQA